MHRSASVGIVAAVAAAAGVLALQGWRERMPTLDMAPLYEDAELLASQGRIPDRGCLSSFGGYIPPGPTWLIAPGLALFRDSRLAEYPGALALLLATALGVYKLGRIAFGESAALAAAAVYCFSDRGMFFASSLWPRGHPCFFVWFVYCLVQWTITRRPRWLAIALSVWAVGMYVFMELSPALLVVPLIWIRHRPPIRWWAFLAAGVVAAIVWLPYLSFQGARGFADLGALLQRRVIPSPDVRPYLCDPSSKVFAENGSVVWPTQSTDAAGAPAAGPTALQGRLTALKTGLTENLGGAAPGMPCFWLMLIAALAVERIVRGRPAQAPSEQAQGVLLRALFVPWILLLLMGDADVAMAGRRFWWLAPLQALAAVGALSRFSAGPRMRAAALCVWIFLVAAHGAVLERAANWARSGWGGVDAESRQALAAIAEIVRREGRSTTTVGYSVEVWAHAFQFHPLDRRYKVGMEWDFVLKRDFGVGNRCLCPEGVCAGAEFTVVERNLPARFPPRLSAAATTIFQSPRYEAVHDSHARPVRFERERLR